MVRPGHHRGAVVRADLEAPVLRRQPDRRARRRRAAAVSGSGTWTWVAGTASCPGAVASTCQAPATRPSVTVVPVTRYVPVEPVVPTNGVPATPCRTAICAPGRSCSSPVVSTDFTVPCDQAEPPHGDELVVVGPVPGLEPHRRGHPLVPGRPDLDRVLVGGQVAEVDVRVARVGLPLLGRPVLQRDRHDRALHQQVRVLGGPDGHPQEPELAEREDERVRVRRPRHGDAGIDRERHRRQVVARQRRRDRVRPRPDQPAARRARSRRCPARSPTRRPWASSPPRTAVSESWPTPGGADWTENRTLRTASARAVRVEARHERRASRRTAPPRASA